MTIAFNLSQLANYVNTSGKLDAANGLVNSTPVANGGTGAATLTANNVLLGNGTSAVQVVAPGSTGNVLTSNGTTWASSAPSGGQFAYNLYTSSSGTWTCPANVTRVFAVVIGGGAGTSAGSPGYSGGVAIGVYTVVPSTGYSYVVGAGATGSATGGTSSFGSFCSATGGTSASAVTPTCGIGSNGNLSNWYITGINNIGLEISLSVGGVFFGNNFSHASSPIWTAATGWLPGTGGDSTYGAGGVVYLQYVG